MRAITHIAASSAVSVYIAFSVEPLAALGVFAFGGFLDIDHLPHFLASGLPAGPGPILRSIYSSEDQLEEKYSVRRGVPGNVLFPLLHCFELAILVGAAGLLLGSPLLVWACPGVLFHIMLDIRSYPCSPFFFSMTWRLFNRRRLLAEWAGHRSKVAW